MDDLKTLEDLQRGDHFRRMMIWRNLKNFRLKNTEIDKERRSEDTKT